MDTLPWVRRTLEDANLETTQVILVVGTTTEVAASWLSPLTLLFTDVAHATRPGLGRLPGLDPIHGSGGLWVAIHDVFADPEDGGRPPFELYCEAL